MNIKLSVACFLFMAVGLTVSCNSETYPTALAPTATVTFSQFSPTGLAPEGILREVSYYGGGGGAINPPCVRSPIDETIQGIYVELAPNEIEPGCNLWVRACGWEDGEEIVATLIYPDGTVLQSNWIAKYDPWWNNEDLIYTSAIVNYEQPTQFSSSEGEYKLNLVVVLDK